MPKDQRLLEGGCMCGAVRYQTNGEPSRVLHCHCKSCRHHSGASMATLAVLRPDQVSFTGEARKRYASASGVERAFCANCGTSLTWETTLGEEPIIAIHISSFDDPNQIRPSGHSFYGERIQWFDAADELPRYAGFVTGSKPVQFGPAKT